MKPSRIRTGLLTLLTTSLLCLGGTAHAQLEEYTNLLRDGLNLFDPLFLKFTGGEIQHVTVRGTIDTTPNPRDNGVGPVFGISGPAVPMVAHLFINTAVDDPFIGPTEFLEEGVSVVDGNTVTRDFVGYKQNQILGIYLVIGGPTGPKKEVGFLNNNSGNAPEFPVSTLSDRPIGLNGPIAKVWCDDFVNTGEPEKCEFFINEGSNQFHMGAGAPFDYGIWVYDGTDSYAFGTVTSVDTVDTSEALNAVLRNKSIAERAVKKARDKVASLKKKAKKKKIRANKYGPYKRAKAKLKRAIKAAKSLGLDPLK